MERLIASAFLILSPVAVQLSAVSRQPSDSRFWSFNSPDYIAGSASVETETSFRTEETSITTPLPFPIEVREDSEAEWGSEEILQEGEEGSLTKIYKISSWYGKEQERTLVSIERKEPQPQIISRGTKKVYRSGSARPCGEFTYFGKLKVWATSYDTSCPGCSGFTATGMKAGYGVVAVDPKVIPLGTRVCVPGYGLAIAGDTGGAVKGLKVDLGFDDLKSGWWSSRWTQIFLLD